METKQKLCNIKKLHQNFNRTDKQDLSFECYNLTRYMDKTPGSVYIILNTTYSTF